MSSNSASAPQNQLQSVLEILQRYSFRFSHLVQTMNMQTTLFGKVFILALLQGHLSLCFCFSF